MVKKPGGSQNRWSATHEIFITVLMLGVPTMEQGCKPHSGGLHTYHFSVDKLII